MSNEIKKKEVVYVYGYIYITTNLINNRVYIGQHKGDKFDPKYIGSGKILNQAVAKYGKENFKTEILFFCESKESLNSKEIETISCSKAPFCKECGSKGYSHKKGCSKFIPAKEFTCPVCGQAIKNKGNLKQHIRARHPEYKLNK